MLQQIILPGGCPSVPLVLAVPCPESMLPGVMQDTSASLCVALSSSVISSLPLDILLCLNPAYP